MSTYDDKLSWMILHEEETGESGENGGPEDPSTPS